MSVDGVVPFRVEGVPGDGKSSEKAELAELRRENARLRMERDLLKRATAASVKDVGCNPQGSR